MYISAQLLNAALQLVIILPFLLLGKRFKKDEWRIGAIFFFMFLLWSVLNSGLAVTLFPGQQWNWTGKAATLILSILFIYRNKQVNYKEMGWTFRFFKGSATAVLSLMLIGLAVRAVIYAMFRPPFQYFNTETILFQGTLAAVSDEIIFRGILLALLNRIFLLKEDIGGFKLSWGVLITSLLFGLTQGFLLQNGFHLQISLVRILLAFFAGLIAALLKERSGSLLPAVIFHALWNLIGNH